MAPMQCHRPQGRRGLVKLTMHALTAPANCTKSAQASGPKAAKTWWDPSVSLPHGGSGLQGMRPLLLRTALLLPLPDGTGSSEKHIQNMRLLPGLLVLAALLGVCAAQKPSLEASQLLALAKVRCAQYFIIT